MRSGTSVAALAALSLAVPATALAVTPKGGTYKATKVVRGYDLKFKVKGAKITGIVGHVLETCDGSSTSSTTTVAPDAAWRIKGGRFSGRKKESSGGVTIYTTFKGRFTSATTAKGIVRLESIVAGSTCDTYELKWTAKRR